jgi:streptogramin lyase
VQRDDGGALRLPERERIAAGDVLAKIDVAASPDPVLLANGDIWVGHYQANGLERVDPKSAKVVAKIPVSSPIDLVDAFGSIWTVELTQNRVARIDPSDGHILNRIEIGLEPDGIAAGFGSIWAVNQLDGTLSRIDPKTGKVERTSDLQGTRPCTRRRPSAACG